jgi:hypothetical protein
MIHAIDYLLGIWLKENPARGSFGLIYTKYKTTALIEKFFMGFIPLLNFLVLFIVFVERTGWTLHYIGKLVGFISKDFDKKVNKMMGIE